MALFVGNFDDLVEISIGGTAYGGWTSVEVTRSVSEMAGEFSLTLHDPMMLLFGNPNFLSFSAAAEPGVSCTIDVAGQLYLTGYIDKRSASKDADSHDVTVSGRGKSRNMVDSSHIDASTQYNMLTPSQIIEKAAKPFGIKVNKRIDGEKPIPVYRYFIGDDAFEVAHEVARQQGLTIVEDENGDIIVRDKDKGAAAGALIQGENIKRYQVDKSENDRHSDYEGKGQTNPNAENRGKPANQVASVTKDPGVKSYRPLVIFGESDIDREKIKRRATHEAARRAGMSIQCDITVVGYRGSSGRLWEPDTLAYTHIPDEGIAEELLIESVTFTKDNEGGSITKLHLTRKEAFEAKPSTSKQGPKAGVSGASKLPTIQLTERLKG